MKKFDPDTHEELYWFFGNSINEGVPENELTHMQKIIITEELLNLDENNYNNGWLGFELENKGWSFMRHGFPIIFIGDTNGKEARNTLEFEIRKIFLKKT